MIKETKNEILTRIYNEKIGKRNVSLQKFSIEVAIEAMQEYSNQQNNQVVINELQEKLDFYEKANDRLQETNEKLNKEIEYQIMLLKRLYGRIDSLKHIDLQLDGEIIQHLNKYEKI